MHKCIENAHCMMKPKREHTSQKHKQNSEFLGKTKHPFILAQMPTCARGDPPPFDTPPATMFGDACADAPDDDDKNPRPTPLPLASVAVVADSVIDETSASEVECASAAKEKSRETRQDKRTRIIESVKTLGKRTKSIGDQNKANDVTHRFWATLTMFETHHSRRYFSRSHSQRTLRKKGGKRSVINGIPSIPG